MLTIMCKPGSTFIEMVRILTDAKFVEEYLPLVKDGMVKRYWTDQIANTSDFINLKSWIILFPNLVVL
jgi:hypothetical protein